MPSFFVGIDIAKATLDLALLQNNAVLESFHIGNNEKEIAGLLTTLFVQYKCTSRNTIYCAEDMGLFSSFLLNVLEKKKAKICMEAPLRIKYSLGIVRGKTDKLDAIRIAKYAYLNQSNLRFWTPERNEIKQLQIYRSLRNRLVSARMIVKSNNILETTFLPSSFIKSLSVYKASSITALEADIERVNTKMQHIIMSDPYLNRLYKILTSIPHIGAVIATEIIICTNEFKSITTAKRFASYSGIAPFRWESGTSIKGRMKVSAIGDKHMKTLLHLAAIGYTRRKDSYLGKYYERKVREGKNKMSVLNAIRNKLVHRIYACVNKGELFSDL